MSEGIIQDRARMGLPFSTNPFGKRSLQSFLEHSSVPPLGTEDESPPPLGDHSLGSHGPQEPASRCRAGLVSVYGGSGGRRGTWLGRHAEAGVGGRTGVRGGDGSGSLRPARPPRSWSFSTAQSGIPTAAGSILARLLKELKRPRSRYTAPPNVLHDVTPGLRLGAGYVSPRCGPRTWWQFFWAPSPGPPSLPRELQELPPRSAIGGKGPVYRRAKP